MFEDLIYVQDNSLEPDFCKKVIEKFEKDDRKKKGLTGPDGEYKPDIKKSTDLKISGIDGWEEEDDVFFHSLQNGLKNYNDHCNNIHSMLTFVYPNQSDTGYNIQRTKPGEFYIWHDDFTYSNCYGARMVTFIWYLNDIEEGGYTEFVGGKKIQPKTGRLLLFPSSWEYVHRGYPPKNKTKYITTGWLHTILNGECKH